MNNIMQIKRGSTESWSLGPELVNFENYSSKRKDSILHSEGNSIIFEIGTGSKNVFDLIDSKNKIYGQWLIEAGELQLDPNKQYKIQARAEIQNSNVQIFVCRNKNEAPIGGYAISNEFPTMNIKINGSSNFCVFVRWDNSIGDLYPYGQGEMCNLTLSIKEVGAYEELAPGQLGVEYTEDGSVKIKAGKPDTAKWNELPYIGIGEQANDDSYEQLIATLNFLNIIVVFFVEDTRFIVPAQLGRFPERTGGTAACYWSDVIERNSTFKKYNFSFGTVTEGPPPVIVTDLITNQQYTLQNNSGNSQIDASTYVTSSNHYTLKPII